MYNKLLGTTLALILAANFSQAQTYQAEGSLHYTSTELQRIDIDSDTWLATGTYYFSSVNTRNHPLAEAAFLEKASNISINYLRSDSSYNPDFGDNIYRNSTDTDVVNAGVEVYIPNSIFYVAAAITRYESKEHLTSDLSGELEITNEKSSDNNWNASLGLTPIAGLLVYTTVYEDVGLDEHWNLNAKYVTDWSGNAVNIEALYADSDGESTFGLLGDFYFDRTFSAGVGYSSDDSIESDEYMIRTRKFFTDSFSIEATYTTSDYSDEYNLGASLRF